MKASRRAREDPPAGKVPREELERSVLLPLRTSGRGLLVPPTSGVDVGAVRLPGGQVLLLTSDPIYVEPAFGWEDAAWFAFHILASDLTTSGVAPTWITLDLNLPLRTPTEVLARLMRVFARESTALGARVVTGHTGRYEGCSFPIVGGATFAALAPARGFVTSAMARPGDSLLLSKGPGLESAALLARLFPERVGRALGCAQARASRALFHQLTTVPESLAAVQAVGLRGRGVWAMHDATEGGVLGAAFEMALASRTRLDLFEGVLSPEPLVGRLCELFDVDPSSASSEGSLLVAVAPQAEGPVLEAWQRIGVNGRRIGQFRRGPPSLWVGSRRVKAPPADGFWPAVERARSRRAQSSARLERVPHP